MLSVMMNTDLTKISGSSTLHQLPIEHTAGDQILFNLLEYKEKSNNNNNNIHLYSAFLLVIQNALQSVNTKFKYNITGFKTPTGRKQPVGYLQEWLRIWARDDREQIQQVARVGLEPGTARLRVRRALTTRPLPPPDLLVYCTTTVTLSNRAMIYPCHTPFLVSSFISNFFDLECMSEMKR